MTTSKTPLKIKSALAANQNTKEKDYWQQKLSAPPDRVEFNHRVKPKGQQRNPIKASQTQVLQKEQEQALMRIAGENSHARHMILMAVMGIQLHKSVGAEDIVLAMPIYKQKHKQAGHTEYINTKVPIRIRVEPDMTFKQVLLQVRQTIREAVEHQNYPIDHLIEKMYPGYNDVKNRRDGNPLYEIAVLHEGIHDRAYLEGDNINNNINIIYGIKQTGTEAGSGISLQLEYNAAKYDEESAARIIAHNGRLMDEVLANPEITAAAVNMQTEQEIRQIEEMSRGPVQEIGQKTVHRYFEEQAAKTPDQTALNGPTVREGNRTANITYRELNERADRLAHRLQAGGVGPDTVVGLKTGKNIEMVIGMLGILKAGGGYLPLDPGTPPERIEYMIKDSNAREVMTEKEILEPGNETAQPENSTHTPGQLCYVIYTSGTTGKPKGVMLEHRNLVNLLMYQHRYTDIDHSRVLQFAAVSFDVSFQEIFSTLLKGGTLYIADEDQRRDVPRLYRRVEKNGIKTMFLPASFAKYVLNARENVADFPRTVEHIVTAGEQIVVGEEFRKLLKRNRIKLHNHYGPSETHVVTTMTQTPDGEIPDLPTIGRPIANTNIEILDRHGNRQPIGIAGELHIAGQSVGRGYQNRPELTAEKFNPNLQQRLLQGNTGPIVPLSHSHMSHPSYRTHRSNRSYKTGDQGRYLGDGTIEYLGRIDQQVKIRGYRIEPGEIETHIMRHPGVREAVVIDRETESGEKYLCAYIVPQSETQPVATAELKKHLSAQLPEYMVPAAVVRIEKIPLTHNRKVDRRALPAPEDKAEGTYVAPGTPQEKKQVQTWARILDMDPRQIGIDDNFFALGGHSLKATGLINRLNKEQGVDIQLAEMFQNPTVRQLAALVEQKERTGHTPLEPAEEKEYYPQSPSQKRLFILQQMNKENTSYNMPTVTELKGKLDRDNVERVFKRLIQRHESFRTTFTVIGEEAVQRVHPEVPFRIRYQEPTGDAEQIRETVNRFIRPFDLSEAPLLRVGVIETGPESHVLIFDMHHIISDGTTQGIFNREFMRLYNGEELPPLKLQYKDYSQWLRSEHKSRELKKQEVYWKKQFKGKLPVLMLPTDNPRPVLQDYSGDRIGFFPTKEAVAALGRIGEEEGASLFMVLQAVTAVWLWKLSGQEDIVIGSPVAARRHADLDPIIGMLVNALVFRNNPNGEKTFRQFLQEVKKNTIEAYDNQEYPFEELVEKSGVSRDPGRNPLFDVMFALQNMERTAVKIPQMEMTNYPYENKTSKFDMNLEAYETGDTITLILEYSTALFRKSTAERFIENYLNIVGHVASEGGPDTKLLEIDMLTTEEKQRLQDMANGPEEPEEHPITIHQWFAQQAEKTPESIALEGLAAGGTRLTYRQLNEKSDCLAHRLREKGVGPDIIVGMKMDPGEEMIIAVLGILKAGGCYLPLDPEYPQERIDYMIKDSNAAQVLTEKNIRGATNETPPPIHPHTDSHSPSQLCYVIYTSGSTGRPKGVMLEHRNLVNLLRYQYRHTTIDHSRVLQFTGISFDVSFQEIFSTLLAGGTLYRIDKEIKKDIPVLYREIRERGIRTLYLPASFLKFILSGESGSAAIPETVAHIVTAGEQLTVTPQFREYLKANRVTLHNHYGPSETHVVTTLTMDPEGEIPDLPPIGRPIANTRVVILDKYGTLQPQGVAGELHIAGGNVGRGYQNQPELTATKFGIELPQRNPGPIRPMSYSHMAYRAYMSHMSHPSYQTHRSYRSYKTGDQARWLPDGALEFLGRIDSQVKIRGYRVELGEIENHLQAMPEIKEAVVTAGTDESGESYLCAYIVPVRPGEEQDGAVVGRIRQKLAARLPQYMQPARYVQLGAIPLTPNKKVDRNALPAPDRTRPSQETAYHPPVTSMEKQIAETWKEQLNLEKIGIHDNFFDLGGNSLKIIAVTAKLNSALQKEISVMEMFQFPTVHTLAQSLEPRRETTPGTVEAQRNEKKEKLEKSKNRLKNTRLKTRRNQ